jgi:hypothetical protein
MNRFFAAMKRLFAAVEDFGASWARRQRLAALTCGLLVLLVRAAELPRLAPPQPSIHDEFSFLLAGDTFASGRLTNFTHPLWPHFESFHIIQIPTYMSMYAPGQGLALAAGQVLFHEPWLGVYFTAAFFCVALCWMLQGWLPPGWAFLGGLLVAMRIGIFSTWMNSYSGTAVAGIGGALVFGALPRIVRREPRARDSLLLGSGLAILANTRPYEGLLAAIPVAIALLVWAIRKRPALSTLLAKVALPLILVLAPAAGATGYYCYRVTGHAFQMPYQVNRETYAVEPYFLWQSTRPEPVYRHEVLRKFYVQVEPGLQGAYLQDTLEGWLTAAAYKMRGAWSFYLGIALTIPLVMLRPALTDRRMRFWLLAGAIFCAGWGVERYLQPHYLAPMAGAFYVIVLQSMRHLRQVRLGNQRAGLLAVRAVVVVCLGAFLWRVIDPHPQPPYPGDLERAKILRQLEDLPGPQLAIVRYSPDHDLSKEWVYNRADIDHAKVVWAREMGPADDEDLRRYFHDRRVWLVEPDQEPPRLSPYTNGQ